MAVYDANLAIPSILFCLRFLTSVSNMSLSILPFTAIFMSTNTKNRICVALYLKQSHNPIPALIFINRKWSMVNKLKWQCYVSLLLQKEWLGQTSSLYSKSQLPYRFVKSQDFLVEINQMWSWKTPLSLGRNQFCIYLSIHSIKELKLLEHQNQTIKTSWERPQGPWKWLVPRQQAGLVWPTGSRWVAYGTQQLRKIQIS